MSTNNTEPINQLPMSTPKASLPPQTPKKPDSIEPEIKNTTEPQNSFVENQSDPLHDNSKQASQQVEVTPVQRKLKPCNCEKR
jgi:hypothetical protein